MIFTDAFIMFINVYLCKHPAVHVALEKSHYIDNIRQMGTQYARLCQLPQGCNEKTRQHDIHET